MENLNLNIDSKTLEQCLKSISDFGGTTYQNICTGASNYVAWGGADWFLAIILCILGAGFALVMLAIFFRVLTDF